MSRFIHTFTCYILLDVLCESLFCLLCFVLSTHTTSSVVLFRLVVGEYFNIMESLQNKAITNQDRSRTPQRPEVKTVLSSVGEDLLKKINIRSLLCATESNRSDQQNGCRLRAVFVDGQNIAINGKPRGRECSFNCSSIAKAVLYFMEQGHTVFVILHEGTKKQFRPFYPSSKYEITDDLVLDELDRLQMIVWVPRRFLGNPENPDERTVVRYYDDNFLIDCAHKARGVIVSNDRFMDIRQKFPEWIDTIDRRVAFKFLSNGTFQQLLPAHIDAKVLFTADVFEPAENNKVASDDQLLRQLDLNLNLQEKKPPQQKSNTGLTSSKRGFKGAVVLYQANKTESIADDESQNLDFLYMNHNAWQSGDSDGFGNVDYDDDVTLPEGAVVDIDVTNSERPAGSLVDSVTGSRNSGMLPVLDETIGRMLPVLDEASLSYYKQFAKKITTGLMKRSKECPFLTPPSSNASTENDY